MFVFFLEVEPLWQAVMSAAQDVDGEHHNVVKMRLCISIRYFNDYERANESTPAARVSEDVLQCSMALCTAGMWEEPDAPYRGPGMNSRAHHMFSSVGHYLTARVAGEVKAVRQKHSTSTVACCSL